MIGWMNEWMNEKEGKTLTIEYLLKNVEEMVKLDIIVDVKQNIHIIAKYFPVNYLIFA